MDVYVCLCTSVLVCVRLYVWTVTVANESVNKGDNYQLAEDWILLTNVPAFQSSLLVMLRDSCYCVCMYVCVCALACMHVCVCGHIRIVFGYTLRCMVAFVLFHSAYYSTDNAAAINLPINCSE